MSFLSTIGIKPYSQVNDEQANIFSKQLHRKISKGDYSASEALLAKSSDENHERLIYGFAASENSVLTSATWMSKHPDSAWANILLGASLIVSGWKIRGSSYAEYVDDSAWAPFFSKLSSSEEPLRRAIQLDINLAEPYSWLMLAGLGQGASIEDQHLLFIEATSKVPLHFGVHNKYFLVLTEKWGGSHKEMFAFARDCSKKAPHGHSLHCLIPSAYCEYALSIASEQGASAAFKKLRQTQYAKDVTTALYAWLSATPENLSQKLMSASGGFGSYALNHFGVALYLCGANDEAKAVLAALNGEIESVPWAWIRKGWRQRMNTAYVYDNACREFGVELQK